MGHDRPGRHPGQSSSQSGCNASQTTPALCRSVANASGVGRTYARRALTVVVSDTTLAIELDDGETRVVRRTTTLAVRNIKAGRPRPATPQVL